MRILFSLSLFILCFLTLEAQNDTSLNQDAIYARPFIQNQNSTIGVGGYAEGNTNYFLEDGIGEGFSMEMRRLTLFFHARPNSRIRFLSELEFEHGTEEIALEAALLDFQFSQFLQLRVGVILPPIGMFNTNHDAPNWNFVERPMVATHLVPTTLSEIGFGFLGKSFTNNFRFSYEAYLTNGLQEGVILNSEGRTHLGSGKASSIVAEDNNGSPMASGRFAIANKSFGEIGFSAYGGYYNTFVLEGVAVDQKRLLTISAIDYQNNIGKAEIRGEFVAVYVDVPGPVSEIYGTNQLGTFVDLSYPIFEGNFLGFNASKIYTSIRYEYVDFNTGDFSTNFSKGIRDDVRGVTLGFSWHPVAGTLLRFNYIRHAITDALGNPAVQLGGFQVGFATYF